MPICAKIHVTGGIEVHIILRSYAMQFVSMTILVVSDYVQTQFCDHHQLCKSQPLHLL